MLIQDENSKSPSGFESMLAERDGQIRKLQLEVQRLHQTLEQFRDEIKPLFSLLKDYKVPELM